MSSTTESPPAITLYPSTQEDVNAYMAAIRLASSVRNSMDAQKASADNEKAAVKANSYVPILNQTSSANFTSNTTKAGFVHPRDRHPPPSRYVVTGTWPLLLEERASAAAAAVANLSTLVNTSISAVLAGLKQHHGHLPPPGPRINTATGPILEDTAADAPAGVEREAIEKHHGYFPPPDPRINTAAGPILEDPAADTPAGVKREAMEKHHGYFPPPDPPMSTETGPLAAEANHGPTLIPNTAASIDLPTGSAQDGKRNRRRLSPPPGKPMSAGTGPIAIEAHHDHMLLPNSTTLIAIPPEYHLYVTNTDIHNLTFAICPSTNRTTTATNLASRPLHPGYVSTPHNNTLAPRDTAAICDAPTGFNHRLLCGRYDAAFALAFFALFSLIGLAWIVKRKRNGDRTRVLDEEGEGGDGKTKTWPRLANTSSSSSMTGITNDNSSSDEGKAEKVVKSTTNGSVAQLRENVRKGNAGGGWLEGERGTRVDQYEAVAWRSASSRRARRAGGEGRVVRDAGPVAVLPDLPLELPA